MGTMDPALPIKKNPRADGYGNNERCLRRDVTNYYTKTSLSPANLASHITSNTAIGKFQDSLQNDSPSMSAIHSSGHFSIWGKSSSPTNTNECPRFA
jgi:tyrosinase